ncbi:DUF1836 domain-containing protein [Desulfosporosinus nitroreducens]|uniref:DUF1836 domain-containing protein n=1 Tax=Desulfosporosinus nitroreducens TaxID=2018668 RepID=A0ABT8QP01_9FIRM|nr:DUF1836 domain-containing protein [Desulfosporosinus nitroreducens]MDO0822360.1 DUF1836 domain-containing protein [Desulfosporosinus nitroreducens]
MSDDEIIEKVLGPVEMIIKGAGSPLFSKFSNNKGIPDIELMASQIVKLGTSNSIGSIIGVNDQAFEVATIQNWVKRGIIESPDGKKYPPQQVARILMTHDLKVLFELKEAKEIIDYGESISNFTLVELYEYHLSLFSEIEKLTPCLNVLYGRALEIIRAKRDPSKDDIKASTFVTFLTISKWASFTRELILKWIESPSIDGGIE